MDQLRKTRTDGLLKKELVNGKLMIGESAELPIFQFQKKDFSN